MYCPLEKINTQLQACPVHNCLYNRQGNCRFEGLTNSESAFFENELEGKDEQVLQGTKRIKAFIYADAFISYVLDGTNALTASKKQLIQIRDEPRYSQSYLAWPSRRVKVEYSALVIVITAIIESRFPSELPPEALDNMRGVTDE